MKCKATVIDTKTKKERRCGNNATFYDYCIVHYRKIIKD